jgi:hypothetical protein
MNSKESRKLPFRVDQSQPTNYAVECAGDTQNEITNNEEEGDFLCSYHTSLSHELVFHF